MVVVVVVGGAQDGTTEDRADAADRGGPGRASENSWRFDMEGREKPQKGY